ncbi:response regulator [Candidatus Saccharibacteria bacterium]|nr:MAG: response regulator [Candidatus Saccharibacteria bacterium]
MPRTHKVLLVEDDSALNDAFGIILLKSGYDVRAVFNGQEALDVMSDFTPDVILLDLLMPIMDGKEFLRRLGKNSPIPIIVFSNLDSKSDVEEVLGLGASRFMLKAWATPNELVNVIQNTLQ